MTILKVKCGGVPEIIFIDKFEDFEAECREKCPDIEYQIVGVVDLSENSPDEVWLTFKVEGEEKCEEEE